MSPEVSRFLLLLTRDAGVEDTLLFRFFTGGEMVGSANMFSNTIDVIQSPVSWLLETFDFALAGPSTQRLLRDIIVFPDMYTSTVGGRHSAHVIPRTWGYRR